MSVYSQIENVEVDNTLEIASEEDLWVFQKDENMKTLKRIFNKAKFHKAQSEALLEVINNYNDYNSKLNKQILIQKEADYLSLRNF